MPGLTHFVSLQGPLGVEWHFAEFVHCAAKRYPQWTQSWLNPAQTIHPAIREHVQGSLTKSVDAKRAWTIKLPPTPGWIRANHCRRALRTHADVVLLWNRTARSEYVLDAFDADRLIHWEHGALWFGGREDERKRFLDRVPHAITNSRAAARILQGRWAYAGDVTVCLNGLRPSLMPPASIRKLYPSGRRVVLGLAARLFPVKGVALALHALETLQRQSFDAELVIAGDGPERPQLEALTRHLAIDDRVAFKGAVSDMAGFYRDIDCLVHSPLTEAFGLVTIEAAAHGCPIIAAAVDGLPEAVAHETSGYCVAPTLPLAEYEALGGRIDDMPEQVFDAPSDALAAPKLVDPKALAAAITRLFADPARYERISLGASERVLSDFRFERHVDDVMSVVESVLQ